MKKRILSITVLLSIFLSVVVPVQGATTSNTVTNGEALKAIFDACRIKPQVADKSKGVYEGYILTAAARKAVNANTFRKKVNQKITRLELADLIVKGLPVEGLCSTIIFGDIKSFNANVITTAEIMGYTDNNTGVFFHPKAPITKSELEKIVIKARDFYIENLAKGVELTKVIKSTEYFKPNIDKADGLVKVTLNKNEDFKIAKYPRTKEEFKNILFYMAYEGIDTYKIDYNIPYFDLATSDVRVSATEAFNEVGWTIGCYIGEMDYKLTETKTGSRFTFTRMGEDISLDDVLKSKKCIKIIKDVFLQLNKEGKLAATMTEKEKAFVLFRWLCLNCEYDSEVCDIHTGEILHNDSYKAYGALINKTAVCQGYTEAYNLMCRYLGIKCESIFGWGAKFKSDVVDKGALDACSHAWTAQILDGVKVWTDATWGDTGKDANSGWFATSSAEFDIDHTWDKERYKEWNDAPGLPRDVINSMFK